jgi:DNA-binding PadR family transcriptional regulator
VDRRVLDALVAEGFVEARPRPDGAAGYYLTESGRRLLDE